MPGTSLIRLTTTMTKHFSFESPGGVNMNSRRVRVLARQPHDSGGLKPALRTSFDFLGLASVHRTNSNNRRARCRHFSRLPRCGMKKAGCCPAFLVGGVLRWSLARSIRRRSPSSPLATRRRGSRRVCSGSGGSRRVPTRRSRGWACHGRRRCPSAGCPGLECW